MARLSVRIYNHRALEFASRAVFQALNGCAAQHSRKLLTLGPKTCSLFALITTYILEPKVFVTVGMYKNPEYYADQETAVGEVLSSNVKGMRQREIGNAQAWYYPDDKLIIIWECFLESSFRTHPFKDDL